MTDISSRIINARVFMGAECTGNFICASCGENRANELSSKKIKSNFLNFDELLLCGGRHLCNSCLSLIDDPDSRFKTLLFKKQGEKIILQREQVLEYLIERPDFEFVLSVPYSFKKHHWLFAGMSTPELAIIGTDTRSIVLDFKKHDVIGCIILIREMINYGVSRKEITQGEYSIFTREKFPEILKWEGKIKDLRGCGGVEFICKYVPAVTKKNEYVGKVEPIVLSKSEDLGVKILKEIAKNSKYRSDDGMRFWGGYYKRRINRFASLPLNEFVSRLCESVNTHVDVDLSIIKMLSEDESIEVMTEMRKKSTLLLSLAYSEFKQSKKGEGSL